MLEATSLQTTYDTFAPVAKHGLRGPTFAGTAGTSLRWGETFPFLKTAELNVSLLSPLGAFLLPRWWWIRRRSRKTSARPFRLTATTASSTSPRTARARALLEPWVSLCNGLTAPWPSATTWRIRNLTGSRSLRSSTLSRLSLRRWQALLLRGPGPARECTSSSTARRRWSPSRRAAASTWPLCSARFVLFVNGSVSVACGWSSFGLPRTVRGPAGNLRQDTVPFVFGPLTLRRMRLRAPVWHADFVVPGDRCGRHLFRKTPSGRSKRWRLRPPLPRPTTTSCERKGPDLGKRPLPVVAPDLSRAVALACCSVARHVASPLRLLPLCWDFSKTPGHPSLWSAPARGGVCPDRLCCSTAARWLAAGWPVLRLLLRCCGLGCCGGAAVSLHCKVFWDWASCTASAL